MQKINNTVVENLSPEMGARIIKAFQALGVNTKPYDGDSIGYYGVINGTFDYYYKRKLPPETQIITIEELEEMAYGNKYPQVMYVSDTDNLKEAIQTDRRRVVFMEKNRHYLAWDYGKTIKEAESSTSSIPWIYAWPIPEEKPETDLKAENEALKKEVELLKSKIEAIKKLDL